MIRDDSVSVREEDSEEGTKNEKSERNTEKKKLGKTNNGEDETQKRKSEKRI